MTALSALLPFVAGAANDWIEPLTDIVCEKRDVRFVPIGDLALVLACRDSA
jgi:hypothetical protein